MYVKMYSTYTANNYVVSVNSEINKKVILKGNKKQ